MLLLAEAKGNFRAQFKWKDFEHAGVLRDFSLANWGFPGARILDAAKLTEALSV